MLRIEEVCLWYGKKKVLDHLDLEIPAGEIHGLVGLNGSGKTSLLNSIFGWIPFEGKITWQQQKIQKKDLSFLETQNFFYSYMTAREYLRLFSHQNPNFDYESWAKLFELPLDTFTDNLSTGMKKKLAFIGVISQQKPLLLLDEPSNGLDLESNQLMAIVLKKLQEQNKTILITTHLLELLKPICQKIHYLQAGKIVQSFDTENFVALENRLEQELRGKKEAQLGRLFEDS